MTSLSLVANGYLFGVFLDSLFLTSDCTLEGYLALIVDFSDLLFAALQLFIIFFLIIIIFSLGFMGTHLVGIRGCYKRMK